MRGYFYATKNSPAGVFFFILAGDEGFEPPNGGTRTHCLTTWRIPNRTKLIIARAEKICKILYNKASPQKFFERGWVKLRKKYSILEISQKSPRELIDDMSQAQFSLLRSYGCGFMNVMYFWVRLACLFFIRKAERRADRIMHKNPKMQRREALKMALGNIFKRGAPSVTPEQPGFPKPECGFVIGFNHPSLGEIIRLMGICMLEYPDRSYLFPVNIVWYEALAPIIPRLSSFGFILMPIITPSARKTLLKHAKKIAARVQVNRLARGFNNAYVERSVEVVNDGQIVLVAPSATRKAFIYPNKEVAEGKEPIEPQTMTMLALSLIKAKVENFAFVPVAVIPPEDTSRGLNLLSSYKIIPCRAISEDMTKRMCQEREANCDARRFERYFLDSIANTLRIHYAGDKIIGPD